MPDRNHFHDAALSYLKLGWSVIPVKKDKKPYIPWTKYQTTLPTVEEIDTWWTKWPTANIGVVTGRVSGMVAVDIDSPIGQEAYKAQFGEIHGTCRQTTGKPGAMHLLFLIPPGNGKYPNSARSLPDVDTRGDGGYIVVAPSVHASGSIYTWEVDPVESPDDLMDLPAAVSDWFWPKIRETAADKKERLDIQTLLLGVQQGQRNDICAKLAGYYLRITKGDIGQVKAIMGVWNDRNVPPLEWKEVEKTVDSIGKRHGQEEIKADEAGGGYLVFKSITKKIYPDGTVEYEVRIDGFDGYIDMVPDDFISKVRFKTKFFSLTDISPKLPKGDKWDDWLTETMKIAVHQVMDEDETALGDIETIIKRGLNHSADNWDNFGSNIVAINGCCYFSMSYMAGALMNTGQKLSAKKIGSLLRRLGCRKKDNRIGNNIIKVWEKDV